MAKRTISFGSYKEPTWEEYTGEQPLPNRWYTGVVKRATYVADRDQMMFIVEITEGEFAGWGKPWYAPLEEGDNLFWKTQEIIRALQGGKQTDLSLDWENEAAVANWLKKAKPIKFKTELYNEDIKVRKVAPLLNAVGGTAAPAPGKVEAELPGDVDGGDEEPLEAYEEDELIDMSVEDLEEILTEEFEVGEDELPAKPARDRTGAKYKALLVEAVLAEQEGGLEDEAAEDGDADADADEEFEDGFAEDGEEETEEEPEPEPAPVPARRARKAAPAAAVAPAKAAAHARRRRS